MKPVNFNQHTPRSLPAAIGELTNPVGAEPVQRKVLAGGQSLGPLLNLRLARPDQLVDLSRLGELKRCYTTESSVIIGATTTHAQIEDGKTADVANGLLRHVAAGIAYRAVRNRGTMAGSLAHADPAADWLTTLTVLNASVHTQRLPSNEEQWDLPAIERLKPSLGLTQAIVSREIKLVNFVIGAYTTVLTPSEIITHIEIPIYTTHTCWGYHKICRKVGELADAIGAVVIDPGRRYCRVVAGALGGAPIVLDDLAEHLAQHVSVPSLESIKSSLADQALDCTDVELHHASVALSRAMTQALTT